jgi:hypothetical protein
MMDKLQNLRLFHFIGTKMIDLTLGLCMELLVVDMPSEIWFREW